MADILKEWLSERLQRPIKWDAEQFGEMMKDGCIIAEVLRSYGVINEEKQYLIISSTTSEQIQHNWHYLREWMKELDVNLPDTELANIVDGRGSSLIRLFYQIFLHLDKRDRTNFIKRERKQVSELVEKMDHRFTVEMVPTEKESTFEGLSRPLLNERHFIEWQKNKTKQVQDTYDYIRHKYSKKLAKIDDLQKPMQRIPIKSLKLTSREKTDMDKFAQRYPCQFKNYTYDQLLQMEQQAVHRSKSFTDSEWASSYMDHLHTKMHRKSDSEEFQKHVRNVQSGSLWDLSVTEEENKLDTDLAKKVLKLSQFEKQMCTQIMETKQQARNLLLNRIQGQKEFEEEREHQFSQFLVNMKEQINIEVTEIDFEKRKQNMLHKKLYGEKMKRKRRHYYEICYDTMLSIVDYVTKYAYLKKLIGDEIPDHYIHEWKTLFYKQQPIFDILDPMENILKVPEDETPPEVEEEIIRLELDRQETLNNTEFLEYHNYSHPWNLEILIPNYDHESEERKYEYLGTRILGHVVYTLLDIKYPYPPPRPPADLPKFSSKAILRGLPDRSMTVAIQTLLDLQSIYVARVETAINFCLRKFKSEMVGCTDIDLSFDKFVGIAQNEENKELIKLVKSEDDATYKISETNVTSMLGVVPPNAKQTQTPKTIPEEEIVLSQPADLGRYAYESLSSGDSLTDHLVAAMLVELIKDQYGINGFVIINYPNSYKQAHILEETFTGLAPPDEKTLEDKDNIFLEETIENHHKKEKDQYKNVRVSKLVNDPHKKRLQRSFESYFTCYINLIETEDILQEIVIWDLTEENSELIDRFYTTLGINYSMYYEVLEKDLIVQICKYIIGEDNVFSLKTFSKLFGENVLSTLDFPSAETKRTKSKLIKPEIGINGKSKERLRRGSKTSKTSSNTDLEIVKPPNGSHEAVDEMVPLIEDENEHDELHKSDYSRTVDVKLLAGEEDWDYGEIPILEMIGIALASCWEVLEKVYVQDMQQLFFSKRLQMNCLIPYARFITDKMEQIITMPSQKQDLVSLFQREYNNFENYCRDVNLTKNEWHCRVKELQNKLYSICDKRKQFAEQQRQALIADNWTMKELTTMANTYISCMQAELNRSILTFQTLHDFYFAMLKRMPSTERLSFKELTKIFKDTDDTSGSKKGGEDKVYRQLKHAYQDLQLKNIKIHYSNNPFNMIIENNVKFALKVIKDVNDSYRNVISREYAEIARIIIPVKKKEEEKEISSEESLNLEEIFKGNAQKCIEEWTMGINGEMFRASLRILALQYKCYHDMQLFNDHIYKTFMNVRDDINSYYMNEIKSVDRLCKYLRMAVENARKIPESLILEHDTFVIDPDLLQFALAESSRNTVEVTELDNGFEFKIGQLARLRSQLKIIAPSGIALLAGFIYTLQDFTFFGKESCEGSLFPELWIRMDPELIPRLIFSMFGQTCYIDWRDFLIYCINMRFPTVDELLQLRKNLRCCDLASTELISRNLFIKQVFWFDTEFDPKVKHDVLRLKLIKHFLFELFEVQENLMNYPAFLLAFCKNDDPIKGFATALSMAVGKKVCYVYDDCEEVICKLIKEKKYRDECLACAHNCTKLFLEKVITTVVNTCESTTVVELVYTEPSPSDRKGKKDKGKKPKATLSARSKSFNKSQTSKAKIAQSEINVKTAYIRPPCEVNIEDGEDKPCKVEKVEPKPEPKIDSSLAYAVSQSVIWNVLKICLPWHFVLIPEEKVTPYEEQVKNLMKHLEVDTDNGDIYVSKFVKDANVCKILHKVKKFTALNLVEEVRKISR